MRVRRPLPLLIALLALVSARPAPVDAAWNAAAEATLVAEPRRVGVGEIVEVEILVRGAAGLKLRPFERLEIPGFWLLSRESLGPEAGDPTGLQRTRLRLRAREAGVHVWPLREIALENAGGEAFTIALPELSLEVHSRLSELFDRQAPFGLRSPPAPATGLPFWLGLAIGAGAVAAALGLRRWAGRTAKAPVAALAAAATVEARAEEEPPDADLWAADPRAAAQRASRLLRDQLSARFGVAARCATREELGALTPARRDAADWARALALLGRLDACRFQPAARPDLEACLAEVRRSLAGTAKAPPEPAP